MKRMQFMSMFVVALFALAIVLTIPASNAAQPPTGMLWYNGGMVRTLVPPAAFHNQGIDPIYVIPGQNSVTAVAPGTPGYHGGAWAVSLVSWNVAPYLLTSAEDVLAAQSAGDVSIVRHPELDNRCPIQP